MRLPLSDIARPRARTQKLPNTAAQAEWMPEANAMHAHSNAFLLARASLKSLNKMHFTRDAAMRVKPCWAIGMSM
jgi:hypothetical protein